MCTYIHNHLTPKQQFLGIVVLVQNLRVGGKLITWGIGALEKLNELGNRRLIIRGFELWTFQSRDTEDRGGTFAGHVYDVSVLIPHTFEKLGGNEV